MIIKIKKNTFHSLKDSELPRACFDPLIPLIQGKGINVKEEVYSQLSEGQKALFMFNAYYNHASKSLAHFYWWSAYYYAQPRTWAGLCNSLQYLQTNELLQLIKEIETTLEARNYPTELKLFNAAYNDLDQHEKLLTEFTSLFTIFNQISPETLKIIGQTIRNNPTEYVHLEEGNQLLIRHIRLEDAAAFAELIQAVEKESEYMLYEANERKVSPEIQKKMILSLTKAENSTIFVAENQRELVGYLIVVGGTAKRTSHSANLVIGIRKEYQGQGIGTQLFEQMEKWAREKNLHRLGLTVMSTNQAGQALYKKMGFELEGAKKHSLQVNGQFVDEYYLSKILL